MTPRNASEIGQRRHYEWLGDKYPSVTTILKAYPKEWLGAWAAKMTAERAVGDLHELTLRIERDGRPDAIAWLKRAPWEKRDAAAQRGSDVHEAAESEADLADVPEAARPRYKSYLGWLDLYRPTILAREGQVFNLAEGYGGSFDIICELYGLVWLVDIKTGFVGHEARLQQAAYRFAEFVGHDDVVNEAATEALLEVERTAILKLTDEGLQFIEIDAGWDTFQTFRSVRSVYDYWTTSEKEPIGEMVLPQTEVA